MAGTNIQLPDTFRKDLLFDYLNRSKDEISFTTEADFVFKLFEFEGQHILTQLEFTEDSIKIHFPDLAPSSKEEIKIIAYVKEWFDLETDLEEFYAIAKHDKILAPLIHQFRGLRLVKVPDLFEAASWSIIGQQINLPFAYQCKRRLIEHIGNGKEITGQKHFAFPKPEEVLKITDEDFVKMKFSRQKVKYLRHLSEAILERKIEKSNLQTLTYDEAERKLLELKGIGKWSANYILMRCLGFKEAFPAADVGLHNALKKSLQLDHKPNLETVLKFAKPWKGWESYATFYLWQSLLN
ncbi:DNA-3-methyladenine glycosylase family protein [Jiulongibacter sp. NS-SX5]|uniref:DNA-3-methyladenine glycosylase family protein n=1 Tax=Jiulongibacter sp. NS-SX5 TaxID=3463854 RepID=UPI004059ACF9